MELGSNAAAVAMGQKFVAVLVEGSSSGSGSGTSDSRISSRSGCQLPELLLGDAAGAPMSRGSSTAAAAAHAFLSSGVDANGCCAITMPVVPWWER